MLQKLQTRVSRKLPYALLLCALATSQTFSQGRKTPIVPTKSKKSLPQTPFESETISINSNEIAKFIEYRAKRTSSGVHIYEVENKTVTSYVNPKEVEEFERLNKKEDLEKARNNTFERNAMIVNPNQIEPHTLVGTFEVIAIKHRLNSYTYEYPKNELIDTDVNVYKYPLLVNVDTKAMYFVEEDDFVKQLKQIKSFENLKNEIAKYGYTPDEDGRINSKMTVFILDEWLITKLKANPNYIKELDNKYSQLASLVKQLPSHSKVLDNYIGLYRVQLSMSTSDINAWRTATQKAIKASQDIKKLEEKLDVEVLGIHSKEIAKTYEDFLDNLIVSRHVLGM